MFKEVKESLYLKDEFVIAISPERPATYIQQDFVEPPGSPDLHVFRLVDMYTRVSWMKRSSHHLKCKTATSELLLQLLHLGWTLIALIAIRQIIQYGPTSLVEDYVQETRRAGRDGFRSKLFISLASM